MINEKVSNEELEAFIAEPVNGMAMMPNRDLAVAMAEELLVLRRATSEPVADVVPWSHPTEERTCDIRWRRHDVAPGPLYTAAPITGFPEKLPCPVLLEPGMRFGKGVSTNTVLKALQRRADYYAELEAMTPEERAEHDANIEALKAMLPVSITGKQDALREAVNVIYFNDSSDYLAGLWSVVRALSPEIAQLLESDERTAFEWVNPQFQHDEPEETLFERGQRLAYQGYGISHIWENCADDSEMDEVMRGYKSVKSE